MNLQTVSIHAPPVGAPPVEWNPMGGVEWKRMGEMDGLEGMEWNRVSKTGIRILGP